MNDSLPNDPAEDTESANPLNEALDPSSESLELPFPETGRVAAVDFGTVRIGIAICDPDRILASPLEVYPAEYWRSEGGEYFNDLVKEERIAAFVVGLPIHCDGGESKKSRECREFANWLASETKLPVRLFDERFTTNAAKQRMAGAGLSRQGKKKRVDAIAALVLLESFLESCRYHGEVAGQSIFAKATGGDGLDDGSSNQEPTSE